MDFSAIAWGTRMGSHSDVDVRLQRAVKLPSASKHDQKPKNLGQSSSITLIIFGTPLQVKSMSALTKRMMRGSNLLSRNVSIGHSAVSSSTFIRTKVTLPDLSCTHWHL